tara:strand:+ start:250 stop:414 length:165 start_codon:yes stop_codon:yes gene_type:complete
VNRVVCYSQPCAELVSVLNGSQVFAGILQNFTMIVKLDSEELTAQRLEARYSLY